MNFVDERSHVKNHIHLPSGSRLVFLKKDTVPLLYSSFR